MAEKWAKGRRGWIGGTSRFDGQLSWWESTAGIEGQVPRDVRRGEQVTLWVEDTARMF